jgi:hypothetical protein
LKTSWLKLLKWRWRGGHRRLAAARLRRQGKLEEAFVEFFGGLTTAMMILEMIGLFPDPFVRQAFKRHLLRKISSKRKLLP